MGLPKTVAELDRIKGRCQEIVKARARMSGASSFVPVPGVDIATDITVFIELIPRINSEFGLTKTQIDRLDNHLRKIVFRSLHRISTRYGTNLLNETVGKNIRGAVQKKLAAAILRKQAGKQSGKQILKYIPLAGQAVAAGLGYMSIQKAGNEHIESCYQLVREIIRERERYEQELREKTKKTTKRKKWVFKRVFGMLLATAIVVVLFGLLVPKFWELLPLDQTDPVAVGAVSESAKVGDVVIAVVEDVADETINIKDPESKREAPVSIEIVNPTSKIRVNQSFPLQVKIENSPEGQSAYITYESSNPEVVSVNNQGVVTGVNNGSATITVKTLGESSSFNMEVSNIIWTADIDYLEKSANITWSTGEEWVGIDSRLINNKTGTLAKEYQGIIHFYSQGLLEFEKDFVKLYDTDLVPTEEIRLVEEGDYYSGYDNRVEKHYQKVSNDGSRLFFTTHAGEKMQYNLLTKELEHVYEEYMTILGWFDLSSDNKQIAINSGDRINIYDVASKEVVQILDHDEYIIDYGIFQPNGNQIATINYYNYNKSVYIWNNQGGIIEHTFESPESTDIAYNYDGSKFAISSEDGSIYLYETETYSLIDTITTDYNKQQQEFEKRGNEVIALSFSPYSDKLLAVYQVGLNDEPEVVVWDVSGSN
ncbi:Ig-like domain-containing protein [Radiobacillus sp. PE A8.2]|uniref:Ig-like domain-containing protein n=1 Tax=Radiobacillus sp. PE A8.2 TaxID=3380349 RepID=UPI00389083A8